MLRHQYRSDEDLLLAALEVLRVPGTTSLARSYLAAGLRSGASLPVMSRRVVAGVRRLTAAPPSSAARRLLEQAATRADAILAQEEKENGIR